MNLLSWKEKRNSCLYTKTLKNQALHEPAMYFPIDLRNITHRHISVIRTDYCNSKLSENILFEKHNHSVSFARIANLSFREK